MRNPFEFYRMNLIKYDKNYKFPTLNSLNPYNRYICYFISVFSSLPFLLAM